MAPTSGEVLSIADAIRELSDAELTVFARESHARGNVWADHRPRMADVCWALCAAAGDEHDRRARVLADAEDAGCLVADADAVESLVAAAREELRRGEPS